MSTILTLSQSQSNVSPVTSYPPNQSANVFNKYANKIITTIQSNVDTPATHLYQKRFILTMYSSGLGHITISQFQIPLSSTFIPNTLTTDTIRVTVQQLNKSYNLPTIGRIHQ